MTTLVESFSKFIVIHQLTAFILAIISISLLFFAVSLWYALLHPKCLNEIRDTKFTSLLIKYRVNYSKELLGNAKNQHFTIEAIANQCGFSSR
jgi:hypothetical protein